jgi:hypothetical protein
MNQALATMHAADGFDMNDASTRVIRGQILKQVDGRNTVDGAPFPGDRQLIVVDVQGWRNSGKAACRSKAFSSRQTSLSISTS